MTSGTLKSYVFGTVTTLGLVFGANAASAAAIDFDGFSYTGTVTTYATLADAQNGTNATTGPTAIPTLSNANGSTVANGRDGYIYADTDTNELAFGTSWYFTPQSEISRGTNGFGNPNNTNTGFVQLYDLGDGGSSVSSLSMGWDPTATMFSVNATGANADGGDFARLWHAPEVGGAAALTAGTFIEYDLSLEATFATATTSGIVDEMPILTAGFFQGIFENTNTQDTSLNGFYVFDFTLQSGTWAEQVNAAAIYTGGDDFESTVSTSFVAPVPVPAAFPLLATAILGIGALRRFRTRQTA